MRRHSGWTALIGCAMTWTTASPAHAQVPPGATALEETGAVTQARQDTLQIKSAAGELWFVLINRDTRVRIDGTAEPDYLHAGVSVRLSAETIRRERSRKMSTNWKSTHPPNQTMASMPPRMPTSR